MQTLQYILYVKFDKILVTIKLHMLQHNFPKFVVQ